MRFTATWMGLVGLVLSGAGCAWWGIGIIPPAVVVTTPQPPPPPPPPGTVVVQPASGAPVADAPPSAPAPAAAPQGVAVFAYSPQMAPFYVSTLFMYAFYPTGMVISTAEYQPGQYTRWSFPVQRQTAEPSWIERARLPDDPQGNQWWKVKFHDGGSGQTTIIEGMFSPDRSRLLRLRAVFPGDTVAAELPVMTAAYYMPPPMRLTPESLQGATTGTEAVTVPAGTFTARHVVFGAPNGRAALEWWFSDGVPGGLLRQTLHAQHHGSQADVALMELTAFGNDAASELGSM